MLLMARDGATEGSWLRADTQSGGKGRNGRQWVSPPGNFHASGLVRLRSGDPPPASLALAAAIALHETASAFAPTASLLLKWPNDLLSDGSKLAGILLEREGDAVVAGFGVNLAHHPDLPDRQATSLAALGSGAPDPDAFLAELVGAFARWLGRWRGEGLSVIREQWLRRAHPVGTALTARFAEQNFEGLFDGLDEMGALRLRLADGSLRVIQAGDVFLLRD